MLDCPQTKKEKRMPIDRNNNAPDEDQDGECSVHGICKTDRIERDVPSLPLCSLHEIKHICGDGADWASTLIQTCYLVRDSIGKPSNVEATR